MMNQYEVPSFLDIAIPEMKEGLVKDGILSNPFDVCNSVRFLTDFTLQNARLHNICMINRCFRATEKLYLRGNGMIKSAIDTIFIASFPVLFEACENCQERDKIQSLVPSKLYSLYLRQISG